MIFKKPKKLNRPATHSENRERLCIICLNKNKAFVRINNSLKIKVEKLINTQIC